MVYDPFSGIPQGIQEFDSFDDNAIGPLQWGTKVEVGSTVITESSGFLQIINSGVGVAGISYLPSLNKFSRHSRLSVDMGLYSWLTGEHHEQSLVLYKDVDNWIKFGQYHDVSEAINSNCYLRMNVAGVITNVNLSSSAITVGEPNTYSIALLEHTIICFMDEIVVTSFEWPEMVNYEIRLEAGTQFGADKMLSAFDYFDVNNNFDHATMQMGSRIRDIYEDIGTLTTSIASLIAMYSPVTFSSTLTLNSLAPVDIEFLAATYGNGFRISMGCNITGAHIDYCRLYDSSDLSWRNQDVQAQDIAEGDIYLVPLAGPGGGDFIAFGTTHESKRLDLIIGAGGKANVANVIGWKKMDGFGSQENFTSLTDGTNQLKTDGSVIWTDDLVLDTINGVSAYWVLAKIITAGAATDKPRGSRVQFCPVAYTDFNTRAIYGSYLIVEIFRKIGGVYPDSPSDVMYFQQCNITKTITIDLIAFGDTKIRFRLSATPATAVIIPYTGMVTSA